ncbi:MAG: TIGR04053 family radical SAM/SPASM domain-containing protein [Chloroflexi bacterium]|nr:TIGR04053 family radical SAM/SPASM domain-containing protein [Chloroflexota bacterium]
MLYWELTRACELACRHCRAEANCHRDPRELTTDEGFRLLDRLRNFGEPLPHLVFTGGDPLKRPDLYELIGHAKSLGFTTAITPSGTYALTQEIVGKLKEAGIWMMALSLDGSTPERHDTIRGVNGSYEWTLRAAHWARSIGLPFQINTVICSDNAEDLPSMLDLVGSIGADRWSLFFLIGTGRGKVLQELSPEETERLMTWLYYIAPTVPFMIKTTEAPHYRRVVMQQQTAAKRAGEVVSEMPSVRRGFGIRDGNGVMFISHIGEIYPSGFLPLSAGNVRLSDPVARYRESRLFQSLRDPDQFHGKCGYCEYRQICGGSRARAYAYTCDPLDADPLCDYQPAPVAAAAR